MTPTSDEHSIPTCLLWGAEVMVGMGYSRDEIKDALTTQKYNEVTATYLLLGRKSEVRVPRERRRPCLGQHPSLLVPGLAQTCIEQCGGVRSGGVSLWLKVPCESPCMGV